MSTVLADAPSDPPFVPLARAAVRWVERAVDDALVAAVASSSTVPPALARVLVGRGVASVVDARTYLKPELKQLPDPLRLAGLAAALDRVVFALDTQKTNREGTAS